MKYIKRFFWRTPLNRKRGDVKKAIETLWKPTRLPRSARQSEGTLYEIFLSSTDRDVHKFHHYFNIYEHHFSKFVGTKVNLLEIGVFKGGSLRMWRAYFGRDAKIVGIDIDESCRAFDGKYGSVRIGDQTDQEFLRAVSEEFGPFEIVIDDGGHNPSQQIISFCALYPLMAPKGVYLCEDTMVNYWPKRQDLGPRLTFMSLACEIAQRLTEPHFKRENWNRFGIPPADRNGDLETSSLAALTAGVHFYDSIVVFERGSKAEPFHEVR